MKMKIYITVLVALIVSGCSVFKSSKTIDMTPFSDNAGILFSEAVKVSRPFQWKHLKQYTFIPEYRLVIEQAQPLFTALNGIVYYSNQVVAINNAKLSDRDKNKLLAGYLSDAMEKALKEERIDSLQVDKMEAVSVLQNIRNAETYLDGIASASPIVNSVVYAIRTRLNEIQDAIPSILIAFDNEIDKEFAATRSNYERLQQLQTALMLSATRLYLARIGNQAQLDTLVDPNNTIKNFIPVPKNASDQQLNQAATYLIAQLQQIDMMMDQMDEIKAEYIAKQNELIAWRTQVDEKIRIARTAITIWAQSHRNLGAGIPVPPLIDVAGIVRGLVGTAAKTVIP
jgi:archaellum component FlaC